MPPSSLAEMLGMIVDRARVADVQVSRMHVHGYCVETLGSCAVVRLVLDLQGFFADTSGSSGCVTLILDVQDVHLEYTGLFCGCNGLFCRCIAHLVDSGRYVRQTCIIPGLN